jgi:hypothetical protein
MKTGLAVFVGTLVVVGALTPGVRAQEIPFGVTPKEVTLTGAIDIGESQTLGFSKGKLTQGYEYAEGNRIGVGLSGVTICTPAR